MAIHRKILRWLENELFEGNIQLGQDLPTDSEIARAIGVGRSRTRDALRTLEDMDLVQLYTGRGKEMLVHLSDEPAAAASAALRLHMSSSRYPTRDLVQTRILLESWAIARIDPKTVSFAEMDDVLAQMEDFDLSIRDFLELLLSFHHQVMRCAGNELLVGLLASVRQPSFESMLSLVGRMPLWSSAVERLRAESRAIAEALKAGDAATARALVIGQLRGMYSEAGIDLEEEATSANGLPGEPAAASFAPVELEDFEADDLVEDFDEAIADDPSFPDADFAVASVEVSGDAQPVSDGPAEEPRSETVAPVVSAPAPAEVKAPEPVQSVQAQPARSKTEPQKAESPRAEAPARPARSVSADVPLSFGTPHPRTATRAPQAQVAQPAQSAGAPWQGGSAQNLSAQNTPEPARADARDAQRTLQSAPAEEPAEPAKVLRAASGTSRRRSGQIISPVRATIIKPVDRSHTLVAPSVLASRAAEPAASSGDRVLRAPSRESVEAPAQKTAAPESAQPAAQQAHEEPSVEPSNRLEAAATLQDTYAMLPHEQDQEPERRGLLSKMKRFFGVDVYEPASRGAEEQAPEPAEEKDAEEKVTAPDAEALARAEAERAERLKAFHAAASEDSADEEPEPATADSGALEEPAVEGSEAEPVESVEPGETSEPEETTEPGETSAPANADAASSTHTSGSALSKGRSKGSKKSKKKRR
ncbi:GntR family transcriptional regulator [Rothia sp. HMSC062F03]|uniref:FCD domain-containing protein n=1 Tax=Rothia sp. HMSC062F03 TaxID=1715153 RepID=UPI0008A9F9DC|nr:FCD domain-containing protein [Rothia sp. HMSC062F03]OHP74310.1 GntR family transcriptional regulator [Rothia sp. HMSC062F03]